MPMSNRAEVLNVVRTMNSFVADLQTYGTDFSNPDTIEWLRKNPKFVEHSNKFHALLNDGKQPSDPNWIEDAGVDIPTSRLWRENLEKLKEKQKRK